ncbi:DUF2631 domain-containing protein [Solihabitans fulvus]|uniref:DUF2631 domain-containing protein n=1 Tax=Solihabitans fulvus TaxID=1892852 RepID=A0A5B2X5L4_9PSEU|nr:DUF2631 domain-containing protein [Solihabitans fulvus]KAA2258523.1 DUF2631 domain-containing protein [Solihabitans fulvus]
MDKRSGQTVDPHEEPSVDWGWHGSFPRGTRIAGWLSAAICFVMLIGNHHGHVEDIWLIFIGSVIVLALLRDQVKRRTSWRR